LCGRFTVKATWAELVALYRLTMDAPPHNLRPRYNVCPTDPVDVVTAEKGRRELVTMRWGLVPWWWSKPLNELRMATFNARAETVETKPVFRDAFKRSRCLIPISGYYEWQNAPSGKQPWYFTSRDGSPLLTAAGLWDEWKDRATGERLKSCTMIITEPNDFARKSTIGCAATEVFALLRRTPYGKTALSCPRIRSKSPRSSAMTERCAK
jgi:putative SOS response-associated peptidase YedK